jgi:hypothetical protein
MQKRVVMEAHYTVCQHSTPYIPNGPTQFYLVFHSTVLSYVVVPCCMNSNINTSFLSQKTDAISFLADNVCLNFSAWLVNVYACTALKTLWFQYSQMKARRHHRLLIQYDWESRSHCFHFVSICEHFPILLLQDLLKHRQTMNILYKAMSIICRNSYENSETLKRRLSQVGLGIGIGKPITHEVAWLITDI